MEINYVPHYNHVLTQYDWQTMRTEPERVNTMCPICGAHIIGVLEQESHRGFHDNFISREEVKAMSSAAWCDPGDHAFKANVEGSVNGTMQVIKNGARVTVEYHACPEHAPKTEVQQTPELDYR